MEHNWNFNEGCENKFIDAAIQNAHFYPPSDANGSVFNFYEGAICNVYSAGIQPSTPSNSLTKAGPMVFNFHAGSVCNFNTPSDGSQSTALTNVAEPQKLSKNSKKETKAAGNAKEANNNNEQQLPTSNGQSADRKKVRGDGSSSTKGGKKSDGEEPAKGAVIPGLNKDHLIPQVKDAEKTKGRKNATGDKKKLVSNPIVAAVTKQSSSVTQRVKKHMKPKIIESDDDTDESKEEYDA